MQEETEKGYEEKLKLALKAEKAYYEDDKPIMTDSAYDALIRELKAYEEAHPEEKADNSPTTRVGGKATSSFSKVEFPVRMLSLKNAFTDAEVLAFMDNTKAGNVGYVIQPKLDGLTLVLWYENGMLVKAATRGNGEVGEDVTVNAYHIHGIPSVVKATDAFMVRGEVVMHKEDFDALNKQRAKEGKPLYANARNVAAGTTRQKDPTIVGKRNLTFYAYDTPGNESFTTEAEMLSFLSEQGFITPRTYTVSTSDEYINSLLPERVHTIKKQEELLPYAIDGAVIKTLSRGACRTRLGEGTHDPNWAIAFKFTPVSAITRLAGVTWQVGRTGRVTPVAELEPVDLCGTLVERASLHNVDYIRELNLHIGDMVSVYKAAEIIPQIDCVVESMNGDEIMVPSICPDCGAELVYDPPSLTCLHEDCAARIKAELRYFVARQNMDIQGIGSAVVEELVDTGKVKSPADLYKLTEKDLITPGLIAETKAKAILAEIEKSKQQPFVRVLSALGIDMVSTSTAKLLVAKFQNIDALMAATEEDLVQVEGIATITALAIEHSLYSDRKKNLIQALKGYGLNMQAEAKESTGTKLAGKTFCITGTLSQPRDVFKQMIEDLGGKVTGSVTSKTDYLLAGEGGGSKHAKADSIGVPIINETQFKELIK